MKMIAPLALALAAGTLTIPALAQFQKPEDAIKYRKASMTLMAHHAGRVGGMASGRIPFDAKGAADSAAALEALSRLPWEGYTPGSDKGDTRALPAIWTESAKFKEYGDKLIADTAKVSAAAKTGNLDAIRASFGAVGQTCKACHDDFRKN
ncbi:MAG: cytochrome c [Hydrogenophaga sp.]|nr:cytochrome c [Hydrogenophaga sp.]